MLKKYLFLLIFFPSLSYAGFKTDRIQATDSITISTGSNRGLFDVLITTNVATPTGAILIYEYDDTVGNYEADGVLHQYRIYSYRNVGGVRIYSLTYSDTGLSTDNGSFRQMKIFVSWNAVQGANGYRVIIKNESSGINFNYHYDTTSTSFYDGDGTESSFIAGSVVTPTVGGADLYISSVTGDMISTRRAQFNNYYGVDTTTNSTFNHGLKLIASSILDGTFDATMLLKSLDPAVASTYRIEGSYAKMEFVSTTAGLNLGHYQWYVDPSGGWNFGMLTDTDSSETVFMKFNRVANVPSTISFRGKYGFSQSGLTTAAETVDVTGNTKTDANFIASGLSTNLFAWVAARGVITSSAAAAFDGTTATFTNASIASLAATTTTFKLGGSSYTARMGGTIFDFSNSTGNLTTVETDLYVSSIPAFALNVTGDKILGQMAGTYVGSTSSKDLKMYVGTTTVFDTGAIAVSLSSSFDLQYYIQRSGTSQVKVSIKLNTSGASTTAYTAYTLVGGVPNNFGWILKLTGTASAVGAASNDILGQMAYGELKPAKVP